ncbi:hypothetical protein P152DRAFT_514450 [Eremomyces bilateralis CBS 781.70]|uniref:P-loop containing nucleoside triphosphate hydrolase protein n=1 Tax=Eremomyces bilateralis CBS 781.70 TaxID=1392243 RepID=A0A6G1G302_9PEZI|nr:uncharacterized protein P152DRAFT_514450 [Eremomyces bilateralis CBS 781.70]KAF1812300.1 hypothetical protein P152DRAFT_514450 [Eremomyces bilateralis CBS 781.70]
MAPPIVHQVDLKTANIQVDQEKLGQLKNPLLDEIDKLRLQHIDRFIPLPQLVVCGNQSSGKSSVLEAISGFKFPVKAGLGTRWATELILRRSDKCSSTVEIQHAFGNTIPTGHFDPLFQTFYNADSFDGIAEAMQRAQARLKENGPKDKMCEDILRIKIQGPDLPHLSLVDLPGVIGSADDALKKSIPFAFMRKYLRNPRAIIMAVVNAAVDVNTNDILDEVKKFDLHEHRTIGIITQVDRCDNRDREEDYLRLAMNQHETAQYTHGWHVVRNRGSKETDYTSQKRDEVERRFLERGIWEELDWKNKGIDSLRVRLSELTQRVVNQNLGPVIADIQKEIDKAQKDLEQLGPSRDGDEEMDKYLRSLAEEMRLFIRDARVGVWIESFFTSARGGTSHRNLRAKAQIIGEKFRDDMLLNGKSFLILDSKSGEKHELHTEAIAQATEISREFNTGHPPGVFQNPQVVSQLYLRLVKNWKGIMQNYQDEINKAVWDFFQEIIKSRTDDHVAKRIMDGIVAPALLERRKKLSRACNGFYAPHEEGLIATFDLNFKDKIRNLKQSRLGDANDETKTLVDTLECTLAFYEIKLPTFIDNVTMLGVERCLLHKLEDIFSIKNLDAIPKSDRLYLVEERVDSKSKRRDLTKKLEALETGLIDLKNLRSTGLAFPDNPPDVEEQVRTQQWDHKKEQLFEVEEASVKSKISSELGPQTTLNTPSSSTDPQPFDFNGNTTHAQPLTGDFQRAKQAIGMSTSPTAPNLTGNTPKPTASTLLTPSKCSQSRRSRRDLNIGYKAGKSFTVPVDQEEEL